MQVTSQLHTPLPLLGTKHLTKKYTHGAVQFRPVHHSCQQLLVYMVQCNVIQAHGGPAQGTDVQQPAPHTLSTCLLCTPGKIQCTCTILRCHSVPAVTPHLLQLWQGCRVGPFNCIICPDKVQVIQWFNHWYPLTPGSPVFTNPLCRLPPSLVLPAACPGGMYPACRCNPGAGARLLGSSAPGGQRRTGGLTRVSTGRLARGGRLHQGYRHGRSRCSHVDGQMPMVRRRLHTCSAAWSSVPSKFKTQRCVA